MLILNKYEDPSLQAIKFCTYCGNNDRSLLGVRYIKPLSLTESEIGVGCKCCGRKFVCYVAMEHKEVDI